MSIFDKLNICHHLKLEIAFAITDWNKKNNKILPVLTLVLLSWSSITYYINNFSDILSGLKPYIYDPPPPPQEGKG